MKDRISVTYENDNGYCGGSMPHHCAVFIDDFEDDMTDEQIEDQVFEILTEDFINNHTSVYCSNIGEVVSQIKQAIASRG